MLNTPGALRLQIGIFGKRNAGKSSLFNALSGQESAIVSEIPGTTADPVFKAMEIPVLGPVLLMDTAGLDDDDALLGEKRKESSWKVLDRADLILLVTDGSWSAFEEGILQKSMLRKTPLIVVFNKADLRQGKTQMELPPILQEQKIAHISLSAKEKTGMDLLLKLILKNAPEDFRNHTQLLDGIVHRSDLVLMVTPIDSAAPKGRLILPHVQAIRDALDHEAYVLAVKENALEEALGKLKTPPDLVITDSQVFAEVARKIPQELPLTSFSILMARMKGDLSLCAAGASAIGNVKKDSSILIAEACTHPAGHEDIGTVKIPAMLRKRGLPDLQIRHMHGQDFPEDLSGTDLVIHCGGCMLNNKAMLSRIFQCRQQNVPFTNYGVCIAFCTGILERALSPFPEALKAFRNAMVEKDV